MKLRLASRCVLTFAAIALLLVLFMTNASAQSLAFGLGGGLPLKNYVVNVSEREFRITPEPGYYPVLKDKENAMGSIHLNLSFLTKPEWLPIFDGIDFRLDLAYFLWRNSVTSYVSCDKLNNAFGRFSDAHAKYTTIEKSQCLPSGYRKTTDISDDNLDPLLFFDFLVGARYHFLDTPTWQVFAAAHLGVTLSVYGDVYWGAASDLLFGVSFWLTQRVALEFQARVTALVTEPPEKTQARINHVSQTGGNIFDTMMQTFAYTDFQLLLRFDLSDI